MKAVVTSDWHGDALTLGVRRFDEVAGVVEQSVEHAIRSKADVYIALGDYSDPDSGGMVFYVQKLLIAAALRLRKNGIKSIWLRGNHDVYEDGTNGCVLTPLRALEDAFLREDTGIYVMTEPRVLRLSDKRGDAEGDVYFLGLPFTPVSHPYDPAETARVFFDNLSPSARTIVLSHLSVPGVVAGEETHDMPRGREVLYPVLETARATIRLQGHYHARQTVHLESGPPMYIPGSLARLTHGDEKHEPGFLVVNV